MVHAKGVSMAGLNRSGWIYLVKSFLSPFIMALMFFWAAGTTDVPRGWLFIGMTAVYVWANALILAVYSPEVCNERQDWAKKKDTKKLDWFLLLSYGLMQFYIQTIVMGLDIANGWAYLGMEFVIPGLMLFLGSVVLLVWAMTENKYFEVTVRIQKDRNQKVIRSGPYAYVRHPGYVAVILWAFAGPLVVGSLAGIVPGAIAAGIIIVRTRFEDNVLQKELNGYKEYAKKVRYRLLPGLW
jgi:protein-S-isoprenylcysteine O-methyltransferase Ste14